MKLLYIYVFYIYYYLVFLLLGTYSLYLSNVNSQKHLSFFNKNIVCFYSWTLILYYHFKPESNNNALNSKNVLQILMIFIWFMAKRFDGYPTTQFLCNF